ncbi:MAG: indolepyruvate ferredoxin oxidoreductase family protein [Betaproteobacteria bacterium]|nr:indolepyruvate ferredoxin oxidoreductase family protein [Betaproteobacteria bacterium]
MPPVRLDYRLDDNLTAVGGRILISGTQALVRLALMQAQLDRALGWNTAGFVSGYRGSPLGGVDLAMWKAQALLDAEKIRFLPAINEELAAAAVLGSQRVASDPQRQVEGVFSLWYGKGPGLDRAGDTLRHGNAYGSSARGGALVVAGDDHGCVSSGMPFQSDGAMQAWSMPVLHPANVAEIIEFGLYGWGLSRFSGAWIGMKAISETVESTATVDLDVLRTRFDAAVDFTPPAGGLHYRLYDLPGLGIEERLAAKLDAVRAFASANPIDRMIAAAPRAKAGIVTCGKAHLDLLEALRRLELPLEVLSAAGVRIYKVGLVFPIEPRGMHAFMQGLDEVLVIEEKAPVVETQLRALLYNAAADARPRIIGKNDAQGHSLLPSRGELRPSRVMPVLADWLARHAPALDRRTRVPAFVATKLLANDADGVRRIPYFCAGCPHNLSTRVPEGSEASGGIGCHGMSGWMERRNTFPQVPMGSEGIDWVAQSFFTRTPHRFQNMGDGTYSHSGYLAIRQAVAAGVNITYKILYNDAVAMTGGQPVDRRLSVPEIARQVEAEGVARIAVLAEDPQGWRERSAEFPSRTSFHARGELDSVQRELREMPGVTVLIYDQVCATEQRRRIKRGVAAGRTRRVFIHPAVCENCGDCTALSNCVAIRPVVTPLGRKRQIDQTVCNNDYACLEATCPAMVTVDGGKLRRKTGAGAENEPLARAIAMLPDPVAWRWTGPYDLVITGVGGTGIITLGALIATAAHLEGKSASVLDFMGFAQKGGAVIAFVRLAERAELLNQTRIDTQQADAMIACDLVVGASPEALQSLTHGRTRVAANLHEIPTAAFVANPDADLHAAGLLAKICHAIGTDAVGSCDAQALSESLLGDTLTANVLLLGFAWQQGLVPLGRASIGRALELNGVAVDSNKLAFACGRLAATDPAILHSLLGDNSAHAPADDLDTEIERGRLRLAEYQNARYARRYTAMAGKVRSAERAALGTGAPLEMTRQFARNYAKLLAYKDEYEVARMYSDGSLEHALKEQFEGDYAVRFHFAPEILVRPRSDGRPERKLAFGSWLRPLLRLLAAGRALRGTAFDPLGWPAARRAEHALAGEYAAAIEEFLPRLDAGNHALGIRLAALPERVRGFGSVKRSNAERMRTEIREILGHPGEVAAP